jgi:hypothetical protein
MKKLLKQRWIAILLFLIGSLHLLIVHQTFQPSSYVKQQPRAQFHILLADEDKPLLPPPTRVVVLGERESGVDVAVKVLSGAFDVEISRHKYIARQSLLNDNELEAITSQTDVLWVIVVRSPCEWAEAMLQLKRDVCQKNNILQNKRGSESCQWGEDSYDFEWDGWQDTNAGEDMVATDIESSMTYQNVFEMRRHNLLITQQIVELVPRHVKIVRLGEFELNPNALIKDLEKEYQFKLRGVSHEAMVNTDSTPSLCMGRAKWKEAQTLIDWEVEGYFGHHALDCHLCYNDNNMDPNHTKTPSIIYLLGKLSIITIIESNLILICLIYLDNSLLLRREKFWYNLCI